MPLRRALSWPALTGYGLGGILGAGIYSVIGSAAGRAGEALWLAFAISAAVALLTALAYAELATTIPKAGAEFVYLGRALRGARSVPFVVGTLMATSNTATAATVSIAFAGYLDALVDVPQAVIAPALVLAVAGIAIAGVKESAWTTNLFTAIEAIGLVLVIVIGATSDRFGDALATQPTADVLPGAALVFFSFLGFENIANLGEETKRPERDLSRAILLSLGIATVLYVLVALATVALLSPADLARSDAPLADALRQRAPAAAGALSGIALFATANTALAAMISASRVVYAISKAGDAPRSLAKLSSRETPWLATLVVAGGALALLPLGGVALVGSVSSFAALVAFAAVHAALVLLRVREPTLERPFRVPGSIRSVPVLPLLGIVSIAGLLTQLAPVVIACGVAFMLAMLVSHRVLAR
jgi:amino acid transporter